MQVKVEKRFIAVLLLDLIFDMIFYAIAASHDLLKVSLRQLVPVCSENIFSKSSAALKLPHDIVHKGNSPGNLVLAGHLHLAEDHASRVGDLRSKQITGLF